MVNQYLVDYIKKNLDAGYDITAIETVLQRTNYAQKDVDEAVNAALMGDQPKKSHMWMLIVVAALIVIAAGVYGYTYYQDSQTIIPVLKGYPAQPETPPPEEPPPASADIVFGPPTADPNYDMPILMPSAAYEIPEGSSASIAMKVYQTDYIDSPVPSISCDMIDSEAFEIVEYSGIAEFGEVAQVTIRMMPRDEALFAQCSISFQTTDGRPLEQPFLITIVP